MRFSWDPTKAARNAASHGVTFEEVKEVFNPAVDALEEYDLDHSGVESRFRTIGPIRRGIVLVVWTERHADTIRIISARFATRSERARYRKYIRGEEP
jgi:uncharacterized DUF497 family protein